MRAVGPEPSQPCGFRAASSSPVLGRFLAYAACHAGGRGFESRRSHKSTCKSASFVAAWAQNDRRLPRIPRRSRAGMTVQRILARCLTRHSAEATSLPTPRNPTRQGIEYRARVRGRRPRSVAQERWRAGNDQSPLCGLLSAIFPAPHLVADQPFRRAGVVRYERCGGIDAAKQSRYRPAGSGKPTGTAADRPDDGRLNRRGRERSTPDDVEEEFVTVRRGESARTAGAEAARTREGHRDVGVPGERPEV
jgi:hypothetical protein